MMNGKSEVWVTFAEAYDASATVADSGAAYEASASEASGIFSSIYSASFIANCSTESAICFTSASFSK